MYTGSKGEGGLEKRACELQRGKKRQTQKRKFDPNSLGAILRGTKRQGKEKGNTIRGRGKHVAQNPGRSSEIPLRGSSA